MFIDTSKLKDGEPCEFTHDYDASTLDVEYKDFKFTSLIHLQGVAEKYSNALTFKGQLSADILKICSRTLKEEPDHINVDFDFAFGVKGEEVIDVTENVREVLIFQHPMSFQSAGSDDFLKQYECDDFKADNPFESLRKHSSKENKEK